MTHCFVSVGETRLFDGIGLGAVRERRLAMVVEEEELRLIAPAPESVPVLTDQRSTPHWAESVSRPTRTTNPTTQQILRNVRMSSSPNVVVTPYLDRDT